MKLKRTSPRKLFLELSLVDFFNQLVAGNAVNGAGLLNGLASCGGAAEAMHTHFDEDGSGFGLGVKNVADAGVF